MIDLKWVRAAFRRPMPDYTSDRMITITLPRRRRMEPSKPKTSKPPSKH